MEGRDHTGRGSRRAANMRVSHPPPQTWEGLPVCVEARWKDGKKGGGWEDGMGFGSGRRG